MKDVNELLTRQPNEKRIERRSSNGGGDVKCKWKSSGLITVKAPTKREIQSADNIGTLLQLRFECFIPFPLCVEMCVWASKIRMFSMSKNSKTTLRARKLIRQDIFIVLIHMQIFWVDKDSNISFTSDEITQWEKPRERETSGITEKPQNQQKIQRSRRNYKFPSPENTELWYIQALHWHYLFRTPYTTILSHPLANRQKLSFTDAQLSI